MSPAVSQVSRTTRTRLRILRRVVVVGILIVIAMIVLSQFTEFKRLATGVLASTAVIGLIVGFAAQHTIGNLVAGVQLGVSQPFKIGDQITFDVEARRLDLDLTDEEIAERVAEYEPPEPHYSTGVMAKYARSVSSASEGAITS